MQRTMATTASRQLFLGRIKTALADKLIDAGIDAPERLLFMSEQEIRALRGVGKAGLAEIQTYRERFMSKG